MLMSAFFPFSPPPPFIHYRAFPLTWPTLSCLRLKQRQAYQVGERERGNRRNKNAAILCGGPCLKHSPLVISDLLQRGMVGGWRGGGLPLTLRLIRIPNYITSRLKTD